MQIKRFEARSMTEALRLVKKEFGDEAVILSARNVKKAGLFGLGAAAGVEITAAIDAGADTPELGPQAVINPAARREAEDAPQDVVDIGHSRRLMGLFAFGRQNPTAQPPAKEHDDDQDESHMAFLQDMLARQTVAPAIVADWMAKARQIAAAPELGAERAARVRLQRLIASQGLEAEPLKPVFGRQKVLALVGPTGVGKTTVCAKLAAANRLAGMQVGLVCCDQQRVGAAIQLEAYARIINAEFAVAPNRGDLAQVIRQMRAMDLVIIDTAGISPLDPDALADLVHLFARLKAVEFRLVLSAASRNEDMAVAADAFRRLGLHSVVFTKLDETATHGHLVNALVRTRLGAGYVCAGQQIPEDLIVATPAVLTDLLAGTLPKAGIDRQQDEDTPPPVQPPAWSAVAGNDEVFVANKTSDVFHHPTCKAVRRIKPDNVVVFHSQAEALGAKYKPCRSCVQEKAQPPFAQVLQRSMVG